MRETYAIGSDLIAAIGRLRRTMPGNADVLVVCDALEERLVPAPADAPGISSQRP